MRGGARAPLPAIRHRAAPLPVPAPPPVQPHFIGFVTHERIVDALRRTFEHDGSDAGSLRQLHLRAGLVSMHGPRLRAMRVVANAGAVDAASARGALPAKSAASRVAAQREAAELTGQLLQLGIVADPLRVTAHADDWIDLRAESDIVPHVLGEGAPIRILLQNFIRLGARHVTVIDRSRHVVGIVTRADVMPEVLHHVLDGMTQEIRSARAMALGGAEEKSRRGGVSDESKRGAVTALLRARKRSGAFSVASSDVSLTNGRSTPPLGPPANLTLPRDRASTWGGRQIVREMMDPLGTIPQNTASNTGIFDDMDTADVREPRDLAF
jgi:CBS domain-containing protein